ncbi:hypothetical protein ACFQE0_05050 [Methylobacterium komagatae]|uniref:Uncharacterized protein n=1 Tax=Methylobacterium komagatae TaxID=374425 RepID=A0ABW2BF53_9HYPH
MRDGMVLAFDARLERCRAVSNFRAINPSPGIFAHPHLVTPNGVADCRQANAFASGELRDGGHVDQQHSVRAIDERIYGGLLLVVARIGRASEASQQDPGENTAREIVWFADRDVPDPGIVDQKPIRQVAFLIDDPNNGVEERARRRSNGPGARDVGGDERLHEGLMLCGVQGVVANDQSRREVD